MSATNKNLSPAELIAIEEHKYYLSKARGVEVAIEEAIEDFLRVYAEAWKRDKVRRDNLEQLKEIEKHKYLRSLEEGKDVGKHAAAEEWCSKHAGIWREERESLERNGFLRRSVMVTDPNGLHMRPSSSLANLATRYDCDIYVHKEGMPYFNFLMKGKGYMNVKSILSILKLGIIQGDTLEFIATGAQAKEALEAIVKEVGGAGAA